VKVNRRREPTYRITLAGFRMELRGKENDMILRVWRGWTTPENADRY
jgi:hypothetical protein